MMNYQTIDEVVKDLEENPVEVRGNIYHPIPFPEFNHLKTSSNEESVQQKWNFIKNACDEIFENSFFGKRVLDVGANGGFYSFTMAKLGAEVVAFEPHERYAPIGQFLAKSKGLPVTWYPKGYDPDSIDGQSFDVGMLLSVFQWMCAGDGNTEKALAELKKISQTCKYLFFELGFNHGKSCIKTRKKNHYAHLINYLKTHTAYQNFRLITKTNLWQGNNRYLVLCSNDSSQEDSGLRKIIRSFHI